jgi:prevent-host-death family protein
MSSASGSDPENLDATPQPPTPASTEPVRISATEAARHLSRIVDRVRDERITYIVERRGTPAAQIVPLPTHPCTLADLASVLQAEPQADEGWLKQVEAGVARMNRPAVPPHPWAR